MRGDVQAATVVLVAAAAASGQQQQQQQLPLHLCIAATKILTFLGAERHNNLGRALSLD